MKRFRDIQGNDAVVTALRQMVDGGKIPHALLLHENDGGGAFPIVLAFLQYLCAIDIRCFFRLVQQLEYSFTCCKRTEDLIDDIGNLIDRSREFTAVQDKARDLTE